MRITIFFDGIFGDLLGEGAAICGLEVLRDVHHEEVAIGIVVEDHFGCPVLFCVVEVEVQVIFGIYWW